MLRRALYNVMLFTRRSTSNPRIPWNDSGPRSAGKGFFVRIVLYRDRLTGSTAGHVVDEERSTLEDSESPGPVRRLSCPQHDRRSLPSPTL